MEPHVQWSSFSSTATGSPLGPPWQATPHPLTQLHTQQWWLRAQQWQQQRERSEQQHPTAAGHALARVPRSSDA
eukprot:402579-Pelagomonas_calceolata.AAC.1